MEYTKTKHWSVVPPPRATYVVPMTEEASIRQVEMMQNANRIGSNMNSKLLANVRDKADDAFDIAVDAHDRLSANMQTLVQCQGIVFLLVACFIIALIYIVKH
jgi:L-alanine-DL-glutamate epimerase-like enolase superfamily enzyme